METEIIKKMQRQVLKVIDTFTGLLLVSMLFVVMIQIIARYIFVIPTPWSEEGSRILMIWICYIGSVSMLIRNEHLIVDVVHYRISDSMKRYLRVIFSIVILILAVLIFKFSYTLITNRMIMRGRTTIIRLPLFWYYGSLPISMALMAIHEVCDIYMGIIAIIRKEDPVKSAIEEVLL